MFMQIDLQFGSLKARSSTTANKNHIGLCSNPPALLINKEQQTNRKIPKDRPIRFVNKQLQSNHFWPILTIKTIHQTSQYTPGHRK